MKNSKSPHRPPEISAECFSFPQKNPQGNIISRQIRRKFRVSEPTNHMHGGAITPHMIRKQYKPTGQITFFGTIHEKNTDKIFPNASSEHRNAPRTIEQRAIHTHYTQRDPGATRPRSLPHAFMSVNIALCQPLRQRNQILVILRPQVLHRIRQKQHTLRIQRLHGALIVRNHHNGTLVRLQRVQNLLT